MDESNFYIVNIMNIARQDEDLVTELCFEFGCSGVMENLPFEQTSATYEPKTIITDYFDLKVYFELPPPSLLVEEISARFAGTECMIEVKANQDWMEEWKKGFEAFALVDDIWVVPSWLPAPPQAKIILSIDPGMAFGTGTHATTQIAARILKDLLKDEHFPAESMIDVGTGTGILAMLAEALGLKKIQATEIEPLARLVAKENVQQNKSSVIQVLDYQIEDVDLEYDIVVANIIDGVLINIQQDLKRLCRPGGYMVLTGILEEREAGFCKNFGLDQADSFRSVLRIQNQEWVGFLVQRLS